MNLRIKFDNKEQLDVIIKESLNVYNGRKSVDDPLKIECLLDIYGLIKHYEDNYSNNGAEQYHFLMTYANELKAIESDISAHYFKLHLGEQLK